MDEIKQSVKDMWSGFLETLGISDSEKTLLDYDSWYFCDNKKEADDLAQLVVEGTKRATTSLLDLYEIDGEEVPSKGSYDIVTNYEGEAVCIIKTTKVAIEVFSEVSEKFALREGEGDKSLKYWRDTHSDFFSREMESYGRKFDESMKVVLEEFEVVYK